MKSWGWLCEFQWVNSDSCATVFWLSVLHGMKVVVLAGIIDSTLVLFHPRMSSLRLLQLRTAARNSLETLRILGRNGWLKILSAPSLSLLLCLFFKTYHSKPCHYNQPGRRFLGMKAKLSKKPTGHKATKNTDQSGLANRRFESKDAWDSTSHITSWVSRRDQQIQNIPISQELLYGFNVPHHLTPKPTCLWWSGMDIWLLSIHLSLLLRSFVVVGYLGIKSLVRKISFPIV